MSTDQTWASGQRPAAAVVKIPTPAPTSTTAAGVSWVSDQRSIIQFTQDGAVKKVPRVRRDAGDTTDAYTWASPSSWLSARRVFPARITSSGGGGPAD